MLLTKSSKWRLSKKRGWVAYGWYAIIMWLVWVLQKHSRINPPKRRVWKDEQKMKSGFSKHFSRAWVLYLDNEPLNCQSKNPDFIFCSSFPNLRLGHPSATSPLFFDNLHFEHFEKSTTNPGWHVCRNAFFRQSPFWTFRKINHESRLTRLSKCLFSTISISNI